MSLSVNCCGLQFKNPLVLASGYLGVTGASLANVVKNGAGGVTSKTLFLEERKGHPNPTVLTFPGGIISAMGLSGEGVRNAKREFESYREKCPNHPMIASIGGKNIKELAECAEIIDSYPVDMIELNFSCPDAEGEMGSPFACDPEQTIMGVKTVRKLTKKPISVKLSPNASSIGLIAHRAEAEGANAITAVDAMGPGMLIDIHMRSPVLGNKVGGVSGQALKPIALRCVYEIYKQVKIPIIGTGGIVNGTDAIEMLMAGATLLGIGSAIAYYDLKAFGMIQDKIERFMTEEGFKNVSELIGLAHPKP